MGFLYQPKPPKTHDCKFPSEWEEKLYVGAIWRCDVCSQIYVYEKIGDYAFGVWAKLSDRSAQKKLKKYGINKIPPPDPGREWYG